MTKNEYQEYQKKISEFFNQLFFPSLTGKENEFSSQSCECCNTKLAGKRYELISYTTPDGLGDVYEYWICTDCMYYFTYGQLDDMTMMEKEDE